MIRANGDQPVSRPILCRLDIKRFRGIKALSWLPSDGVNIILGGGDVGKTTILEAIGLLLSPAFPAAVPDTDYFRREIEAGFVIEAVMRLPPESRIYDQTKPAWPWIWNGTEAVVPCVDDETEAEVEPVYRFRVSGIPDLDLIYEIVQPDGNTDHFSVALRRSIGLVWLAADDRYDRDLRLVQGSALDRLLSDKGLRSRFANSLGKAAVSDELSPEGKAYLRSLDEAFKLRRLPNDLDLAITGARGLSVSALIGLTATWDTVSLPLACWGGGTRRFAALAIAEQNQGLAPVTLVDEVERGLEPYRQRALMDRLCGGQTQTFVTTHSPAVLGAAAEASIWFVDHKGRIGEIDRRNVERHLREDPEAFLARLMIVAEGATECGFVTTLLEKALGASLVSFGVHVVDAGGNESALNLLDALRRGGLTFGGFADDEGKFPDRWQTVSDHLGPLLFRWTEGCLEENVISCAKEEQLEAIVTDPEDSKTGIRLGNLRDRLGLDEKGFAAVQTAAGSDLRSLILSAALGKPTSDSSQSKRYRSEMAQWFKSKSGGRELAEKVFTLGLWVQLRPQLMPFCNAVREAIEMDPIEDLQL